MTCATSPQLLRFLAIWYENDPLSTRMVRMSAIIIAVILSAATAEAQNYPPFLHEAEQALANEFWKLGQQDWQEWRAASMATTSCRKSSSV